MNQTVWLRCARLWCQGLLLFTLRFAQLRTGFDPETATARLLILVFVFAFCLKTGFL